MTVSSEVNFIEYNGDGVTTTFPIPFYFILNSDISAQIADADGNITDLTYGVDYSVSGAGSSSGGSATMNTAYASGYKILFYREPPATQETAYYENGKFPAKSHEKALDKLTMLIQSCFSGLGLALRKPSILAGFYDAKGNQIQNLADPAHPQDAVSKIYSDSQHDDAISHSDSLFKKTLRIPENHVAEYPPVEIRANMLVGCNDIGNFVPISGQTSTADLAIKLAASSGSSLVGYRYGTVFSSLNRSKTYSDYGKQLPVDGFDSEFYSNVFEDKASDNDLYIPGRINLASDLYGTSNYATLLNLLGNNDNSFRAQVVSGNTSVLSDYAMVEDLLIYGGIIGKASVTTSGPTYTPTSITITDGADKSKLKRGSVIRTSDSYWGKVVSVSGNTVTVDGWYKSKVAGTPSGLTAELNRIDKTYFENCVMWIPATYTGTRVVGAEWDFMIANANVTEKNGWDMVVHQSSVYNMDTAFRTRSAASGIGWATALRIEDINYAGIYIGNGSSGLNASLGSIVDASVNQTGIRFQGLNTVNSVLWRYPSTDVYPSSLNPYGFKRKGGAIATTATSGIAVTLNSAVYYINNNTSAFSLVLPTTDLIAGQEIDFEIFGTNAITVTGSSSSVNVNGATSYTYTPSKAYSRARSRWNGSGWYFFA